MFLTYFKHTKLTYDVNVQNNYAVLCVDVKQVDRFNKFLISAHYFASEEEFQGIKNRMKQWG